MYTFKSIFKESIGVLIFAALLSTFGGIALRSVQGKLLVILPIIILLPALSDMIGDFGITIVSKFTTGLYLHKVTKPWYKSHFIKHITRDVIPVATIASFYISIIAIFIAMGKGYTLTLPTALKIILITLLTAILLVLVIMAVAILGGLYVFHKKKDPDDVLIPLTTSIADLACMSFLALLVFLFF